MAKKSSGFKRALNVVFNIFWAIFGGIGGAIFNCLMGIATFCMIIPIFFGIPFVYFKLIPLIFAPAGKSVKLHFGQAPVRNIFYWIFGGFGSAIGGFIYGAALCCTIIGIPLGLQQFKFAKYYLAPFRAEVIKDGQNLIKEKK